jgi:hypothetical protein
MAPSGAMTGEEETSSTTRPAPGRFWAGSTPVVAPARQPPG